MEDLKKCPFCGGEAILEVYRGFNIRLGLRIAFILQITHGARLQT